MVESSERTSTSRESAAASDPTGSAGASAEGLGPAGDPLLDPLLVDGEHPASRTRTAGIERTSRGGMVPQDKLPFA
jgi:hypothetical protein